MNDRGGQCRGQLVVISGPSGAGKGTICRELVRRLPEARISVSATTRPQSSQEVDGRDYFFLDRPTFRRRLAEGVFLEWAEVFGHFYGTPREPVEAAVDQGATVLLDIDVQGGRQVKQAWPTARMVFVLPPSREELRRRLIKRARDDAATIERRLQAAGEEILIGWQDYEILVINDDLEQAVRRLMVFLQAAPPALSGRDETDV